MKRRLSNPGRRRSLDRLVRIALGHWEGDRCWSAIHELRRRASPATLALAQRLSGSRSWRRRALGVNIAAQLRCRVGGRDSAEYAPDETRRLLRAGLLDPRAEVIEAAATGLGHRPDAAALYALVQLASHPNAEVRYGVSFALGSYGQPEAIDALLALAADADDKVRDWATFALGTLHDVDTPAVRDRLSCNLRDACANVRSEAVMGLARRGDARALDHLLAHLGPDCQTLDLEAAGLLADPRLVQALEGLDDGGGSLDWRLQLHAALGASKAASQQP